MDIISPCDTDIVGVVLYKQQKAEEKEMKKCLLVVLLLVCVCFVGGCANEEAIVGQWKYENSDYYYIILTDGTIFNVGRNAMGDYITSVIIEENGNYHTHDEWYKDGEEYHWLNPTVIRDEFPNGWDRTVRIDGDTMVIGNSIYEWHRLPRSKELSTKEILYFTFDEENSAYVSHPLSELIG